MPTSQTQFVSDNVLAIFDKDHKVNRLYIHWDILMICNFKCAYCYAFRYNKVRKVLTRNELDFVLKVISKAKLPVFLGIQGGEPTLHPDYFYLLDQLLFFTEKDDWNRSYLTSNMSKPVSFFKKHPKSNSRVYYLMSVHPQYKHFYSDLVDKIDILRQKGYKVRVNVMLVDDEKYYDFLHHIIDELQTVQQELGF